MKFKVSETYQQVTPESAEFGDFSETGFNFKDEIYTLRELIDFIKRSNYQLRAKNDFTDWLSTEAVCIDYQDGTEESTNLHIEMIKREVCDGI